jgi:hypothetical protein
MKPRIDATEFHRMAEAGEVGPENRVELIGGEIVPKPAISTRRAACILFLSERLTRLAGAECLIGVRSPLHMDQFNEIQPDVAALNRRRDYYGHRCPEPSEARIVLEAWEPEIDADRRAKLALYARAAIREAWIVDMARERIEIHTEPWDGTYCVVISYGARTEAASRVLPNVRIRLADLTEAEDEE